MRVPVSGNGLVRWRPVQPTILPAAPAQFFRNRNNMKRRRSRGARCNEGLGVSSPDLDSKAGQMTRNAKDGRIDGTDANGAHSEIERLGVWI